MMEQKAQGRQKQKNENDLKKQCIERKKESLKKLQETSKLLLKRNLKIKSLQTKKNGWSSQSLCGKKKSPTINSIQRKEVSSLSKLKAIKKDCSIINKKSITNQINHATTVKDSAPLNEALPLKCSNQLVLYQKTEDISDNVKNNNRSCQEDLTAVKIQKAFKDLNKSYNKNSHPIKVVESVLENETKMIYIKSDKQTEKDYFPTFPSQTSIDYPYNFITAVKKKLNKALNSPMKKKDDKQSSRIFKSTRRTKEKSKDTYQDFSTKPSFINLYNITPVHPFFNSAFSKPRSHTSETSMIKYFDSSNTSCEVSLYKKSSNVTSLSEYPSDSKIKTQSALRTSTVISELKSSLEEIQNLTVSITYNGLRDNQSFSTNLISGRADKNVSEEYKMDTSVDESHLEEDDQANLNTIETQTMNEPVPVDVLNAPDINLIWSRNHNSLKEEYNNSEHIQKESIECITPELLHKSFESELNLLESFNKSLQQFHIVEETLTSIRDDKFSDKNTTQIEDGAESSAISKNVTITKITPPTETLNKAVLKQNDCSVASHKIDNLSSSNSKYFDETFSNTDVLTPFTLKNNKMTSEILTQIFKSKNATIDVKNIEPKSRNKNIVYSQREYVNQNISVKHSLSCEDEKSLVSLNESSSTGINVDKSSSYYFTNNNLVGQLNRFCVCLVNQYIEDEKSRSEFVNNLLKVREKNLLDATRNELSCLEFQKKQNSDQIPFLKKKQRGLVLKLQQERNEIKHIKKFQQEQSQERKMALRRHLKYLKRMFAYEENLLDIKKKTPNFKNSNFILQSNRSTQNSPFKGINISLSSSTNTMNSSFSKLKECLQKKRMDLIEQKKKMHELLQIHYNLQLDTADIKAMEYELKKQCSLYNFDESRNSLMGDLKDFSKKCNSCKYINVDEHTKNNLTNSDSNPVEKALQIEKSSSIAYGNNQIHNNIVIPQENSLNECVLSGSSLNNLWEKITGKKCEKYGNLNNYVMSKKTLDVFFAEAKQIAIQDLLKSLEYDTKINNSCMQTEVKKEFPKTKETNLNNHEIIQENRSGSSLNLLQTCENYSVKSNDTPVTENTVNYLNSTKILNNLLQSQSYDLKELRMLEDSCNNIQSGNINLQSSQIHGDSSDLPIHYENVLSETFTVDRNLSDSCDQSDASKSTAHSLVEELTNTDIAKLNECCENENINLIQTVPLLSVSNEKNQHNIDTKTDDISNKQNINEIPFAAAAVINISNNQSKQVIAPDTTVIDVLDSASVILSSSQSKGKSSINMNHGDNFKISNPEANKIEIESKMISPKLKDKTNKGLKKFQVSFKNDGLFDHSDNNKNKSLSVKFSVGNKSHVNLKAANDASLEISSKDTDLKLLFADDKTEFHSKITSFIECKSPIYSQLLTGSWEATSPSPEPSPRDSPTGEYSPASAVTLPTCQVDEAEELRKKQLAIELEIKALEQQSQIPYCLVREIPDKPPPPYTPPTEETKLAVSLNPRNLIRKPVSKVFNMIESCSSWLWLKFSSEISEPITYCEFCKYDNSSIDLNNSLFLFEICREIFEDEFSDKKLKKVHVWEYQKAPKSRSMNKVDVCLRVQNKVKQELGLEFWPSKDNHIISRPHKRQDYLSELLTKELYQEESSWANFELYENKVKNELTVSILNSLIIEAFRDYKSLFLVN